jgi:hypothetical protein
MIATRPSATKKQPLRYRIEREASEERAWQEFKNVFRRLMRLPINRAGQQAYDEYISEKAEKRD